MIILQVWQQISRLINGAAATNGQVLAYNATTKRFEPKTSAVPGGVLLHTTVGGGATETIAIPGVLATDVVHVTLHTAGNTPRTVLSAQAGVDEVDVVFSGDPAADHIINVTVSRP